MDNQDYENNWVKPVHRIGRITLLGVCLSSFLPVAYLYFAYGVVPPVDWIVKDILLITASFGFIWLIEPITFFRRSGSSAATRRF